MIAISVSVHIVDRELTLIADKPRNSIGSNDQANEIRLKELEIEKEKMKLRGTLIKVWVFIVVVLAVVAIEILMKDRDNPNSLGYLLPLVDFNMALWPVLFIKKGSGK